MSNQALQAALAAKKAGTEAKAPEDNIEAKAEDNFAEPEDFKGEIFQFNISPSTYNFRCTKTRVHCPDGTYRTENPEEIAELNKKVAKGLCQNITKSSGVMNRYQTPTKTAAQLLDENGNKA